LLHFNDCAASMHRALPKYPLENNVVSPLSTVFLVLQSTDSLFVLCCSMTVSVLFDNASRNSVLGVVGAYTPIS